MWRQGTIKNIQKMRKEYIDLTGKHFPSITPGITLPKKKKKCLKCRVALYFIGMDGFA